MIKMIKTVATLDPKNVANISINSGLPLQVITSNSSLDTPKTNPININGKYIIPKIDKPNPNKKCNNLSFNSYTTLGYYFS